VQYRLYAFFVLLLVKENGRLEDMNTKSRLSLGVKGGYLAAYFLLLLFSVAGLMLQGGSWVLIGIASWFSVVLVWFFCYNYLHHVRCSKISN